jgi:hypothetical protein
MLHYGTGARRALKLPVADGQFCALFPEMNVALESCVETSSSTVQSGRQTTAPAGGSENARLRLLRQHDRTRTWNSARDKRVCMLCGSEFEGVQIRVSVRAGKPVFGCPEVGCRGSLPHFATCGNPLLDDAAWSDWMRPPCEAAAQEVGEDELY